MKKQIHNVLALFGVVMLVSGLLAWRLHVPEGPAAGDIIYGENSNYLTNLAAGTSGQALVTQGAGSAPAWANVALATSTGVRLAAGTLTLDGSNPSTAATGLTSISACTLTMNRSAAPGDEVAVLSYTASGGTLSAYAWTNTGGTDPTLAASTDNNDVIAWMCQGT